MGDSVITEAALKEYLTGHFALPAACIGTDSPIFSAGLLDSFHLIELLIHLETAAGIKIHPGEISLENLDTIGRMIEFAARKRAAAAA